MDQQTQNGEPYKKQKVRHDSESDGDEDKDLQSQDQERHQNHVPGVLKTAKGGLLTAQELKMQNDEKDELERQDLRDRLIDQAKAGHDFEKTVYRDKEGAIVTKDKQLQTKEDQIDQINKDNLQDWKGGWKEHSSSQPHVTPEMREAALKKEHRFGDPLKIIGSSYVSGEKSEYRVITTKEGLKFFLPKCKHPTIPNRFETMPGCRWDGVDRSNQYEKRWMDRKSQKQTREDEAYTFNKQDL